MEMTGSRTVPTDAATTWQALNDPEVLKACIPGCESIESAGPDQYRVAMTARVGPVSAKFTGRITLSDIVSPTSYTLSFDGQGGAAGFAKGEARVSLLPDAVGTRVDYTAKAQVGGKLAQIGSRLVDGAAAKVADDFFARFVAHLSASSGAEAATVMVAPAVATTAPTVTSSPNALVRWISIAALIVAVLLFVWLRRA